MLRRWLRNRSECSQRLLTRTAGQDLIEYAILIALISTTVLVTITGLGVKVPGMYSTTAAALPGEVPGGDDGPSGGGNPGQGNPGNDKPVGNSGPDPSGGRGK